MSVSRECHCSSWRAIRKIAYDRLERISSKRLGDFNGDFGADRNESGDLSGLRGDDGLEGVFCHLGDDGERGEQGDFGERGVFGDFGRRCSFSASRFCLRSASSANEGSLERRLIPVRSSGAIADCDWSVISMLVRRVSADAVAFASSRLRSPTGTSCVSTTTGCAFGNASAADGESGDCAFGVNGEGATGEMTLIMLFGESLEGESMRSPEAISLSGRQNNTRHDHKEG